MFFYFLFLWYYRNNEGTVTESDIWSKNVSVVELLNK